MRKKSLLMLILYFPSICLPIRLPGDQRETTVDLLERCQECKLFLNNQKEIRGKLINLQNDLLEIEFHEKPRNRPFQIQSGIKMIPFDEIRLLQCGDPTYDGVIWGFLAGAFIGTTYMGMKYSMGREPGYQYDHTVREKAILGLLIGGGIGIPIGYLLDGAIGYPQETKSIQEWLREEGK